MRSSLKYLFDVLGKKRLWIFLLTIPVSIYSLLGLAYALLFKNMADSTISGSITEIKRYIPIFVVILLFQSLLNAFIHRAQEKLNTDIENLFKKRILKNILFGDYKKVSDIHSGEWMNKITGDILIVSGRAVFLLPSFCSIIAQIFVSIVILARLTPGLTVLLLLIVSVALIFEFFFYRKIKTMHKEMQQKDGKLRVFLQECLNSLIVIKSYDKQKSSFDSFDQYLDDYKEARLKKNLFSVVMSFFFGTGVNGALVLASIYCAYEIVNHRISYGTLVAVVQIITQIRGPIVNAYSSIPSYYSMIGSLERLQETEGCLEEYSASFDDVKDFYQKEFKKIELSEVSFEYQDEKEDKRVISNLSLDISKNSFTCIFGPSGCGKSTLFKLLLSLYQPLKGEINIVCKDNKSRLDPSFRKLFAYVPQENLLMKGSIKDVICFGDAYDEMRMKTALEISCCDEFIKGLPEGIETQLKEKGSGLSEGQMQRISIARAIYSKRPILLLDEATSALNEQLELRLLDHLRQLDEITVLLITHRRNAAEYADQVIDCAEENGKYFWKVR